MYFCGPDSSFVFGMKPNNNLNGAPVVCPPLKSSVDVSKVSSFSIYSYHSVLITNDGLMKAIGSNKNNRISGDLPAELLEYTEFHIRDKEGNICIPISAVCGNYYTLYLVLNPLNKEKHELAYSSTSIHKEHPAILDVGSHNPIAIYGGENHSAAIDSEGQIILIPNDIDSIIDLELPFAKLPNNQKPISIACLEKYFIVLTSSGKLFTSPYEEFAFSEVKELSKVNIVQISGVMLHCLAVSNDGRVFGLGSNKFGKLALPKETKEVEKFTEIKSFGRARIKQAFAGFQHSIFITYIGKMLVCGLNKQGQLFQSKLSDDFIGKPIETTVEEGTNFCIAGNFCSVAFTDSVPKNLPNKNSASSEPKMRAQKLDAFPSLRMAIRK